MEEKGPSQSNDHRTPQFEPMTIADLIDILGSTIKQDNTNKVVTFLACLTVYTENSQLNVSFNAPSSTGKSYIPLEVVKYFPEEDVDISGYRSPAAFYHEAGEYVKERQCFIVDLSNKIIVFIDQPHSMLLERLRPVLSHDKKEIECRIADKSEKGGNRTKVVIIKGFPVVIFCTAGLRIDEQESTRFLVLSPEATQEKIRRGIIEKIRKEADQLAYLSKLNEDRGRRQLQARILATKEENISDVILPNPERIEALFLNKREGELKPRHQRDVAKLLSIVKALTLLNCFFRERRGSSIVATDDDVNAAFEVFDSIAECQELNIAPYVYDVFMGVILPIWKERTDPRSVGFRPNLLGLTRTEIMARYKEIYKRALPESSLRIDIIPALEKAGLIVEVEDPDDRRKRLVRPIG
jgi:hypothetical protein